jgi:hypothetical protein
MQAMESLEQDTAHVLAFKGNSGCSLPALFEQVHASGPFGALAYLPDTVKDILWRKIIEDSDSYLLYCLDKQDDITADIACRLGPMDASYKAVNPDPIDKAACPSGRKKKGLPTKKGKQADGKNKKKESELRKQQEIFLLTEEARCTLGRVDAESRGVVVGLSKVLRLVALGIRAGCQDRCTGNVPELTLV